MDNEISADANPDLRQKLRTFSYLGLALLGAALLAIAAAQSSGVIAAVGICTIILLTSGAVGAALGFLFALPRILSKDGSDGGSSTGAGEAEAPNQSLGKRLLGTNTNLERVSDWLTTIIIGVGLTQLSSIN